MRGYLFHNGTIKREIDALNRVIKYEDTFGNVIGYRYDPIGNLSAITYPDGTEVSYEYDVNNNLVSVTDWEDRKTVYTYDANNRVTGVIKPDGSVTATEYDNAGRVISTVEKNARGVLITGFEYTYDILGRVSTEKHLDKNIQMCYTYDERSRVTQRAKVNYNTGETTDEAFTYDAAGNIITTADNCDTDSFSYDKNNRLTYHNGMSVTYDADGNMTSAYHDGSRDSFRYDSTNRLIGTNTNAYTYNAENVRIRNLCGEHETTYVYNTNAKLSSMLMKTTDGVVTKYVYGRGLIGEETNGVFNTYHFDYRGSTVAITDINGNVTDRFEYDTYGKLTSRTGTSDVIFLYNGRDGVVTDANGLIYMRARYYSPELRRFINADILAGDIANAVTLNRYAYANGNPVSLVDPFGLSAEQRGYTPTALEAAYMAKHIYGAQKDMRHKNLNVDDYVGINNWRLYDIKYNEYGLKIGIYYYFDDSEITSYTIVNAGSSLDVFGDLNGVKEDWANNIAQPFGYSIDMHDSIAYAEDFVKAHPDAQITFVGHSKGGAEAVANAVATNKDCIVFNPATPYLSEYGLSMDNYDANMTAYIVEGEILDRVFGAIPAPYDDNVHYLKEPVWKSIIKSPLVFSGLDVANSIYKHSMGAVIKLLK